jgi:hypothetical protein
VYYEFENDFEQKRLFNQFQLFFTAVLLLPVKNPAKLDNFVAKLKLKLTIILVAAAAARIYRDFKKIVKRSDRDVF